MYQIPCVVVTVKNSDTPRKIAANQLLHALTARKDAHMQTAKKCTEKAFCANCHGNHSAAYLKCVKYLEIQLALRIRADLNCTFKETLDKARKADHETTREYTAAQQRTYASENVSILPVTRLFHKETWPPLPSKKAKTPSVALGGGGGGPSWRGGAQPPRRGGQGALARLGLSRWIPETHWEMVIRGGGEQLLSAVARVPSALEKK